MMENASENLSSSALSAASSQGNLKNSDPFLSIAWGADDACYCPDNLPESALFRTSE